MAEWGGRSQIDTAHDGSDPIGALLVRVAAGDRAAFRALYDCTSAKLFGLSLRIMSTHEEAEEVLQEMYISVWHRAGTFRPERGRGMTWLIALTRNAAIDRLRARRPVASEPLWLADGEPDPAPPADAVLERQEERGRLARCLDRLSATDAALIRTAFFDGATYSDLATRAAQPLGTIKSRIRRALIKLRTCLA